MFSLVEYRYPGLTNFSFNRDILIKLGRYLLKSHPFIFEMENQFKTKIEMPEEVLLDLGSFLLSELGNSSRSKLSAATITKINSVLNYFVNIPAYADACHDNMLNKRDYYQQAAKTFESYAKFFDFQKPLQHYFIDLCSPENPTLKQILLKLIHEDEFAWIRNISLDDSPLVEQLLALLLIINEEKHIISNMNRSHTIFSVCLKHLILSCKQNKLSLDDLLGVATALVKFIEPDYAVNKVITLLRVNWDREIGYLSIKLVKEWRNQYEAAFLQIMKGSVDDLAKTQLREILTTLVKARSLNLQNMEFISELDFAVSSHSNVVVKYRCSSLSKSHVSFLGQQLKQIEGLYEPIRALFLVISNNNPLADPNTKALCGLYKAFVQKTFADIDPILEDFEILQKEIEDENAKCDALDWKGEAHKLVFELGNSFGSRFVNFDNKPSKNSRWLVMEACLGRMKSYKNYEAELAGIINDLTPIIDRMKQALKSVKNCAFVERHLEYLIAEYDVALNDMHSLHRKCQYLYESFLDIFQDIGRLTRIERPAALSQFFLINNVSQGLLGCKKEAATNLEQNLNLITGCK